MNRRKLLASAAMIIAVSLARGQRQRSTRIVLLGTQGGPNFNPIRNETATALVVDDEIYLVDCGYGALRALSEAGLNYRDVANIFLTHLHDDHTGDVAALLSHQWTDGRIDPTRVMGPYGTAGLVAAALDFAKANTEIRLVDEGRSVLPESVISGRDLGVSDLPSEVFSDSRVAVSAVGNTHFSVETQKRLPHRSLSYRFDAADRSVVFSGDTAYSDALIGLAAGADVLVCEVIDVPAMRASFERRVADGAYADNPEGVWDHIVGTHTSTEEAGKMAMEAGVTTLVMNHLAPGALADLADDVYIAGARKHFDGEIIVGRDLMVL